MSEEKEFPVREKFEYAPFFDLSPDVLCIASYDGYFLDVNSTLPKLLGYSKEELLSKPISSFVHPDDRDKVSTERSSIRNGGQVTLAENRYITQKGDIVWLHWTAVPFEQKECIYAIARDITYKKRMEDERNQHISRNVLINQNLRNLTYSTTHDLRTPLNNILSAFNLIDINKIQDEETAELVGILESSTKDLKVKFDEYVDLLKNQQMQETPIEQVDPYITLKKVTRSLQSLINDSGTRIKTSFPENSIPFNQAYLESIFLNLISNSIKYAHPERSPEIHVDCTLDGDQYIMEYSDNGIGIDMEKAKEKIFGLNQSFHDHKDSKGIGLYLVKNQMNSLGGNIDVESQVNKGTTFYLRFKN